MKTRLAENIRAFRKERALTQEQLAEVLGVTVGAVYKWESKLSTPELGLIMEMADFFDTSVDVLLGYEMKDNRLKATIARLWKLNGDKDPAGLEEAEKALKKYPHNLQVVNAGAFMYMHFGEEDHDRKKLLRALELLELSLLLFEQNTDPMGDKMLLYQNMAAIYLTLGDTEKAVEMLRTHNPGGVCNDWLGLILAIYCKDYKAALPCLSHAMLLLISSLFRTSIGFAGAFHLQGDEQSAKSVLTWGMNCLSGLRNPDTPSYIDRVTGIFLTCLAGIEIRTDNREAARESLKKALELAVSFDSDPNYRPDSFRFVTDTEWTFTAGDNLGRTASESLENLVKLIADSELSAIWKELKENEKNSV